MDRKLHSNLILALIIVGIPTVLYIVIVFQLGRLAVWHDTDSQSFDLWISDLLGIGCSGQYSLSEEDAAKLAELGIPEEHGASAIMAQKWIAESFDIPIDVGIVLAIRRHEDAFGNAQGSYDGLTRALANPHLNPMKEAAAVKWLLNHWQLNDCRAKSLEADRQIYSDYSGYKGHWSAGEIGPGFIPSSAETVCKNGLRHHDDSDIAACDLFGAKGGAFGIAWYLQRIGYRADQSRQEKFNELFGWNQQGWYRDLLLDEAVEINKVVGDISVIVSSDSGEPAAIFQGAIGSILRDWAIQFVEFALLYPKVGGQAGFALPLNPDDIVRISQGFNQIHPGIDYSCYVGTPILAAGDAVVEKVLHLDYAFGIHVWLKHQDGLYTVYAHLSEVSVPEGTSVRKGEVIGECGSTGHSTGPHLHYGAYTEGPDTYHYFADAIDPDTLQGVCTLSNEDEL